MSVAYSFLTSFLSYIFKKPAVKNFFTPLRSTLMADSRLQLFNYSQQISIMT